MTADALVVLVTSAGSGPGVSVLRALRSQSDLAVRLIACDAQEFVAGRAFADEFVRVPLVGDGYVEAIRDLVRSAGVQLVVPCSDREALALNGERAEIEADGARLAVAALPDLEAAVDKWRFARQLRDAGIPTPRTGLLDEPLPDDLAWPLVVKPRRESSGGSGVQIVEDATAFEALRGALQPQAHIWQEFVEGAEYTVDLVCDFEGHAVAAVARERVEVRAGQSYKGRVLDDPALVRVGVRVAELFRSIGGCNVQCIRGADGVIRVIELNPRFAAAVGITVAGALVDTPLILARLAAGAEVTPRLGPVRAPVFVARYWSEVVIDGAGRGAGGVPGDG